MTLPSVRGSGPLEGRRVAAGFRATLVLLCIGLAPVAHTHRLLWPWVVAVGVVAATQHALAVRNRQVAVALLVAEIVVVSVGVVAAGGDRSPLLVVLPAPVLVAGLMFRRRGAFLAVLVEAAVVGTGSIVDQSREDGVGTETAKWIGIGLAFGILAAWARRLEESRTSGEADRYDEAYDLLAKLRPVAESLPGGLDPVSTAEALLERCLTASTATRGAVLAQAHGDEIVPLAVRGVQRVPWRNPATQPGPLQTAWRASRTVVDRRAADPDGRRGASTLLVLPITSNGRRLGLVVLESPDASAFDASCVALLEDVVATTVRPLETSLLFDDLQLLAKIGERTRLAQEIHDGVAQDLAYVGFELDFLRREIAKSDPVSADAVATLRQQIRTMISDLRLSITQLRSSLGPERGLGAALTGYVQSASTGKDLSVHLSLNESGFRLAAGTEVQLLQIAQAFVNNARRCSAGNLWVSLTTDAPAAHLVLEHDSAEGPLSTVARGLDVTGWRERLLAVGGRIDLQHRDGRICLEIQTAHEPGAEPVQTQQDEHQLSIP